MTSNQAVSDDRHKQNLSATKDDGVKCELDGIWVHSIPLYLQREYPELSVEGYSAQFYGAELYSPKMKAALERKKAALERKKAGGVDTLKAAMTTTVHALPLRLTPAEPVMKPFAEVFGLGDAKAAKNARGEPIMVEVFPDPGDDLRGFIPKVDPNYIFPIDVLKGVMMAAKMDMACLLWGMHGTGKTTIVQQWCAHTKRPAIRIQHTISTEEAHILGQYVLRNGATEFQPGPLSFAMREGLTYIADEYDFAMPSVLSLYQPVLEGQSLVIKDAPPEWRIVEPHKNFRFVATGNTNGGGDETGLYQGTQMQNAANYSRFGLTMQVEYMPLEQEVAVVASQAKIHADDARKLVQIAQAIREGYTRGDIGVTVSPRELIRAGLLGRALGGIWKQGLALAYTNRLNSTDRKAVMDYIQRVLPA